MLLLYILSTALFGHVAAQTVVFDETPSDTLVIIGDDTQLNCSFEDGGVPYTVVWHRGISLISEDRQVWPFYESEYDVTGEGNAYNLRIYNANRDTESAYSCGDKWITTLREYADVYVIDSGTMCRVYPGTTIIADNYVILSCSMDLDDSAPGDLVWYQNGVEVMRKTGMENTWTTTLYKDNNGDMFDCQLEHYTLPRPKWSQVSCDEKIVMNVQYTGLVTLIGSDKEVRESESVNFTCTVTGGNPDPFRLEIYLDNILVKQDEDEQGITYIVYSILESNPGDEGSYTCVSTTQFYNGHQEQCVSDEFYLTVIVEVSAGIIAIIIIVILLLNVIIVIIIIWCIGKYSRPVIYGNGALLTHTEINNIYIVDPQKREIEDVLSDKSWKGEVGRGDGESNAENAVVASPDDGQWLLKDAKSNTIH